MKINEIIRKKRIEHNMTQDQMANILGVTAPAVNKWEKGASYPDITLLPSIARLLETDLNTLLSFKDEPDQSECIEFINRLSEIYNKQGFDKVYAAGMDKIREYPNCDFLIINIAMFLEGCIVYDNSIKNKEKHKEEIERLYKRMIESSDNKISETAKTMMIPRYIDKGDFKKVDKLIESLPDRAGVDKSIYKINILMKEEKFEDAAKLSEERLFILVHEINDIFLRMIDIAVYENRGDDAEHIVKVAEKFADIMDLWEYNRYLPRMSMYMNKGKKLELIKMSPKILKSVKTKWDLKKSPLYRHIKTKKIDSEFQNKIYDTIEKTIKEQIK